MTSICEDQVASSINHKFICNSRASFSVAGGDSGSPVFYWWWFYGVDTVELIGLTWGSDSNGKGRFSPWSNVENELGSLSIRYPYF